MIDARLWRIGDCLLLAALAIFSACDAKYRNFGPVVDEETLRTEPQGMRSEDAASPAQDGYLSDASNDASFEGAVSEGSGICREDGTCRCDSDAESCAPLSPCDAGTEECNATCPGCTIGGECFADGSVDPTTPCRICDITLNGRDWSNSDGASCNDSLFCTSDDRCSNGSCSGTPLRCEDGIACNGSSVCEEERDECSLPTNQCGSNAVCSVDTDSCVTNCTGCLIEGVCLSNGAELAGNPCLVCDPLKSTTSFSAATGKACGAAASACSQQDTCSPQGACQANHLSRDTPCGNSASTNCDEPDACDGSGQCQSRRATNGTTCEDNEFCTVGDQCQGGECVSTGNRNCGANQACNESANQCQCQGCVVGSTCFAPNGVNGSNPCQICDPARSRTAFSPNVNALCGASPTECSGQDTCNTQGQCVPNHVPLGRMCATGQCNGSGSCLADTTPPVAGGGISIIPNSISFGSVQIGWNEADDDQTPPARLDYAVVHSLADNLAGSAQQILGRPGVTVRARTQSLFAVVVFPSVAREHFLTVVVTDEAGNASTYSPLSVIIPDPETCTSNGQCLFGICTIFFEDADRDGFGNPSRTTGTCGTSAPNDFVTPRRDGLVDCCDLANGGSNFHPSQEMLFARGTPACARVGDPEGWDYNCSGRLEITHNDTAIAGVASCLDAQRSGGCTTPFWSTSPPPCGASGQVTTCTQFLDVCSVDIENPLVVQTIVNACQ